MVSPKLKIGQYGNELRYIHIIDLDVVASSPIKLSLKHSYSGDYLREDGEFQHRECFLDCSYDQENQAVLLPVKPFRDLFAGEEIQFKLNAGNFSQVWKYTTWPELIGEPITRELLSEPFKKTPPQPEPPQPEPPQPEPPQPEPPQPEPPQPEPPQPEPPQLEPPQPEPPQLEPPQPERNKKIVPLFLIALLLLASIVFFIDNDFKFFTARKTVCTNQNVLLEIFEASEQGGSMSDNCRKQMTCNSLISRLKTSLVEHSKYSIYLGEMFDSKSRSQELRKQFECPFAADLPLAAQYYGDALANNVLKAKTLLNDVCNGMSKLDAYKASDWCED